MTRSLGTVLGILLVGVLATAFYSFTCDDEPKELSQRETAVVRAEVPAADLVRRHLNSSNESGNIDPVAAIPVPMNASRIHGKISIEVVDAPDEKIEAGQIELRVLGLGALYVRRIVSFQDSSFDISLSEDDYCIVVDALIIDGVREFVAVEKPWFERQSMLENGLQLKLKLGALQKIRAIDAETGESLSQASCYDSSPTFIFDADGSRLVIAGRECAARPLVWRLHPEDSQRFFIAAPGYVPLALTTPETTAALARAGRLEVTIEAPWKEIEKHGHNLSFGMRSTRIEELFSEPPIPSLRLANASRRHLTIEGITPGSFQVCIKLGAVRNLTNQVIEIVAGQTSRVRLAAGLEGLKHPATPARVIIRAPADVLTVDALYRATLTPIVTAQSLNQRSVDVVATKALGTFEPGAKEALLDFGRLLPGAYEFKIFDDCVPIVLSVGQVSPVSVMLPSRPDICLRVVDRQGRQLDGDDLQVHLNHREQALEYSADWGGFLVPARNEGVGISRRDANGGLRWVEEIAPEILKAEPCPQVLFRDAFPVDVYFEGSPDWGPIATRGFLGHEPTGGVLGLRDRDGKPVPIFTHEWLYQGTRIWVETRGTLQISVAEELRPLGDHHQTVEAGPRLYPRVTFRFPGVQQGDENN